jgi:hypothetical protein
VASPPGHVCTATAFFRVVDGRITRVWGLEDTVERLCQLGLDVGH